MVIGYANSTYSYLCPNQDAKVGGYEAGGACHWYGIFEFAEHSEPAVVNVPAVYKDMYAHLQTPIDMIENDSPGNTTLEEMYRAYVVSLTADYAEMLKTTMEVGRSPTMR